MGVNERTRSHFPGVTTCGNPVRDGLRLNLSMSLSSWKWQDGEACIQTVQFIRGTECTDETTKKTISVGYYTVNNYF